MSGFGSTYCDRRAAMLQKRNNLLITLSECRHDRRGSHYLFTYTSFPTYTIQGGLHDNQFVRLSSYVSSLTRIGQL